MVSQNTAQAVIIKYQDMVYRIAFVYLKNRSDAQDITQEVFLKYLKSKTIYSSEEHLKAWLIKVTANTSKSLLRSAWLRRIVPLSEKEDPAYEQQPKSDVYYAVLELPVKYRSVVLLYYFEDYSVREIAQLLGRTESSVQTQLQRARAMLKQKLKEEWGND